jgi:hypothetical protein
MPVECFESLSSSAVAPVNKSFEFGSEVIKEKRFNHFQDVLFGGVMRALCAALLPVHDGLKERTKYGWGYGVPTKIESVN